MKQLKNINRRKALSSIIKGGLGATAVIGNFGSVTATTQTEERIGKKSVSKKPMLMKVGSQQGGTGRKNLEYLARHGVFNFDGGAPKTINGVGWDLNDSLKKREACEKYGISLDAYHLPLTSVGIERISMPNIMLGKSPERDREIEMLQQMIWVAHKTGVKILNYNTTIHVILRTGNTLDPTRGNASYKTWNYEEAIKQNKPNTIAGEVSIDEVYERITYLLDRLIPVAEEYNIKLANHIADPPVPVGFRGITRWNSPDVFKGIKRFAKLYDSPSHGFNLCLGSVAEGLKNPKTEILPIIKWVGERQQIFNIHLRNIKGGWNNFMEVYPDNGDLNYAEIIKSLRDVAYDGIVMPDHTPSHNDPASTLQGQAFAFGYIKALIQALGGES
ncbi:MAG: mannonate dehydratase [Prolixibacteraceae bacterium]|jgi:mannonate dehydratase|nr:mannonate dehydratase [Prolixibacteraceae bacterium]MBT7000640.1 mannonate dehydratase [Prolixibacteraceae bacterium]MBT7396191.1 mannonate dehydratase [Prolixibacteraceae bacterium]